MLARGYTRGYDYGDYQQNELCKLSPLAQEPFRQVFGLGKIAQQFAVARLQTFPKHSRVQCGQVWVLYSAVRYPVLSSSVAPRAASPFGRIM